MCSRSSRCRSTTRCCNSITSSSCRISARPPSPRARRWPCLPPRTWLPVFRAARCLMPSADGSGPARIQRKETDVYKGVMFAAVLLTAFALTGKAAGTLERLVKVGDGLQFPEGPAYDGKGNVVVSNCSADYVTRFDAQGHATVLYKAAADSFTFQKTNGMTYYKDGSLFVCDFGRNAIIRIHPDGKQEVYADRCDGQPFKGPNDLAFDPHGNLYFSDPAGSDEKNPIGCVYRVEQGTRKVTRVAEGMAFPNGVAFSADAKTLYVAESNRFRILRFAVQA